MTVSMIKIKFYFCNTFLEISLFWNVKSFENLILWSRNYLTFQFLIPSSVCNSFVTVSFKNFTIGKSRVIHWFIRKLRNLLIWNPLSRYNLIFFIISQSSSCLLILNTLTFSMYFVLTMAFKILVLTFCRDWLLVE